MNKLALIFSGQGSQYVGMGKYFYDNFSIAKETFIEANDVLGINLTQMCLEDPHGRLNKTEFVQPAILTVSVAMYRVLEKEFGLIPSYMAGHSLGEISALTCASAISFADAVRLVKERGRFMQEAVPIGFGTMAAINGLEVSEVEDLCRQIAKPSQSLSIACHNSVHQVVISGEIQVLKKAVNELINKGTDVRILNVSAPFHSLMMEEAAERLYTKFGNMTFAKPIYPVVSSVTALPYRSTNRIMDYLSRQITEPVLWHDTMEFLKSQGIRRVIEVGPKDILKKLTQKSFSDVEALALEIRGDWEKITSEESEKARDSFIKRCLVAAVSTKNFNPSVDDFERYALPAYHSLENLQEKIDNGHTLTTEMIEYALRSLQIILSKKQIAFDEQQDLLLSILQETGNIAFTSLLEMFRETVSLTK
ncbi:ACP S-malonyltransferase [Bacillus pacificus]|uniref:ACP S-malonyltransferase n=1 Tax=Bacillus pacificus TaxID=2026187 RepID=UPI003D65299E